jgi:hypothetical protein
MLSETHASTAASEDVGELADLLKSMEFKTYSELSVLERQTKAACEEQLRHPEREIFKPSQ